MRRRGLAWAVVLAMACVGRPASADLPRNDAFLKRVDAAVTKGAEWLAAAHRAGAVRSDLVVSIWTRAADDDARGRIARRCAEVGRRMVWPLLRRLEAPEASKRSGAVGLLRGMTGRSFGYDPARETKDREEAFVAWQMWWLENETTLTYDAASGLLR